MVSKCRSIARKLLRETLKRERKWGEDGAMRVYECGRTG